MKVKNFMKKAIAFCLGLAMTAGVGLGVAGNRASEVDAITNAPIGTVLWGENFAHFGTKTAGDAGTGTGTTIYDGANITYQCDTTSTGYNETLAGGTAPEFLLKSGKVLTVSGIKTGNASEMALNYLSNNTKSSVTCSTSQYEITGSSKSYTLKLKSGETAPETLTIAFGCSGNTRLDNIELKVTEAGGDPTPTTGYTVSFAAGTGGSGSMNALLNQTSIANAPECKFTAPTDKEFDYWSINGTKVEYPYSVIADCTFTANWKDKAQPTSSQWSKVSNTSDIKNGDKVLLVTNNNGSYFNGTIASGGHGQATAFTSGQFDTDKGVPTISLDTTGVLDATVTTSGFKLSKTSGSSTQYLTITAASSGKVSFQNSGSEWTFSSAGTNANLWYSSVTNARLRSYNNNSFRSYGSNNGDLVNVFRSEVSTKVLESIAVSAEPSKTTYYEGETFNPAGLVITATYDDKTTADITYADNESDFTFNPSLSTALTTADTSVKITYKEKDATQAITVNSDTLNSISLGGSVSFNGTAWDLSGVTLTGHYVSGDRPITSFTPTTTTSVPTKGGIYEVSVSASFGGKSDNKNYSVTINKGTLQTDPLSVTEALDICEDHTSSNVTDLYYVEGDVTTAPSTDSEKKYGNLYIGDDDSELYIYGCTSTEGKLTYNGTYWSFSNPQDYSKNDLTKNIAEGDHLLLKLRLYGFTKSGSTTPEGDGQVISVSSIILSSIKVSGAKTEYEYGEEFVKPTVTATYNDSSTKDVSDLAEFSGNDMTISGSHIVTAKYVERGVDKYDTFTITVGEKPVDKVTVYFKDSIDDSINYDTVILAKGNPVDRPTIDPEKEHHSFRGWFEEKVCENEFDFDTEINDTTSIYAGWTEDPKYTVSYDLNGGTGTVPESHTDYEGESYTIASGEGITKDGFRFEGWNTSSSGNGDSYKPGQEIELEKNLTLYAQWEGAKLYSLVTDASELKAGDKLLIVGKEDTTYYSLAPYVSGNNCKRVEIDSPDENDQISTIASYLTLGGEEGNWTLFDGSNYLYAAGGSSSNHLKGRASNSDSKGNWTISCGSDGVATIKCVDSATTRNWLRHNSSDDIFSCYASGQSAVSIYRQLVPEVTAIDISAEEESYDLNVGSLFELTVSIEGTDLLGTEKVTLEYYGDIEGAVSFEPATAGDGDTVKVKAEIAGDYGYVYATYGDLESSTYIEVTTKEEMPKLATPSVEKVSTSQMYIQSSTVENASGYKAIIDGEYEYNSESPKIMIEDALSLGTHTVKVQALGDNGVTFRDSDLSTESSFVVVQNEASQKFGSNYTYADKQIPGDGKFYLADSETTFAAGDEILFAFISEDNVFVNGPTGTGKASAYLSKVDSSFDEDGAVNTTNALTFILEEADGGFYLHSSLGYFVTSGADIALKDEEVSDEFTPTIWNISVAADGIASISVKDSDPLNRILYNVNSPRFKTYTSSTTVSMVLPRVCKKDSGTMSKEILSVSNYTLRFSAQYSAEDFSSLFGTGEGWKFGFIYGSESKLGEDVELSTLAKEAITGTSAAKFIEQSAASALYDGSYDFGLQINNLDKHLEQNLVVMFVAYNSESDTLLCGLQQNVCVRDVVEELSEQQLTGDLALVIDFVMTQQGWKE